MRNVGEITVLVKYSPKREPMLGTIKDNFETEDEDVFDNTTTLSELCVTRWTVRATALRKVLTNYSQLIPHNFICLQENLDRETRSRIIGCQAQMKLFKVFYGMHLSYKLYSITDNLSKTLQRKESMSKDC